MNQLAKLKWGMLILMLISNILITKAYAGGPVCSGISPTLSNYITNIESIITAITVTQKISESNVDSELYGTIDQWLSPIVWWAWNIWNIIFDNMPIWWWTDFFSNYMILSRSYPVLRDRNKLIPMKNKISKKIQEVWLAGMLNKTLEPWLRNQIVQKTAKMPLMVKNEENIRYWDIMKAIWLNQISMEKIFLEWTTPDADLWQTKTFDWLKMQISKKNLERFIKLNKNILTLSNSLYKYYETANECTQYWQEFMDKAWWLEKSTNNWWKKAIDTYNSAYIKVKDALVLWIPSAIPDWEAGFFIDEPVPKDLTKSGFGNYNQAKKNQTIIESLHNNINTQFNWVETMQQFQKIVKDSALSPIPWLGLSTIMSLFTSESTISKKELQNVFTLQCEYISDIALQETCEEQKAAWLLSKKVSQPSGIISRKIELTQTIQWFTTSFISQHQTLKNSLAEGANLAINWVTLMIPRISRTLHNTLDVWNDAYDNLIVSCKNQCPNLPGKCEASK